MKLTQPTKAVFNWSLIIAIVAAVCFIVSFIIAPALLGYIAFGLMTVAFVLLTLGVALKGF
jgi:hypothetical protein